MLREIIRTEMRIILTILRRRNSGLDSYLQPIQRLFVLSPRG